MVQRVRSIHGQFITVEEKAAEDAAIAAKFGWKAPDVVCADIPGHPNKRIVSLRDPDDLLKFGGLMGHCAGTHSKWASEERIWAFVTVLDQRGEPHGTLHLKDCEWAGREHPDDAKAYQNSNATRLYEGRTITDYSKYWVPSSTYGAGVNMTQALREKYASSPDTAHCALYGKKVLFEGKPHNIVSIENRYGGPGPKALAPMLAWIEANLVEE